MHRKNPEEEVNHIMMELYIKLQNRLAEMRNEDGATAAEYGLLVALIAAVIVTAVATLGTQINAAFEFVSSKLPAA
jgi:pilus assembly protein Flp/PilA